MFRDGEVFIGPIPKDTPVSLFTSMDLGADMPESERKAHTRSCSISFKQITRELKRGNDPFADRNIAERCSR